MHWIIGTAGHIDHGKTSLVKALTGQDTDRLKEEKERGISIDLGFAHLDLPDGTRAGVVDVPGHERFIRNMLAGAHGIDLVLFVVAADDGVMPQTREHLDILHLLGVTRAIVVVTKVDLASEGRLHEVTEDVRHLIAGTSIEGALVLPFSLVTGAGLDALRNRIAAILQESRRLRPQGYFRLPVDRAFASPGHGLIVTGTAVSGEVRPGDVLRRLPGEETLRVRGVEVHNEPVDAATWGQRIALNLTGDLRAPIVRGDVVCDARLTLTCDRFDAWIEVRKTAPDGLTDHQRVRVHVGTAERMGKIIPLRPRQGADPIRVAPGEAMYCQIAVEEPLVALRGDRVVLRDATAQRTIAGGRVLLPGAVKHKRGDRGLLSRIEALDRGNPAEQIEALLYERGLFVVDLGTLAQLLNQREDDVRQQYERVTGVHVFNVDAGTLFAGESSCRRVKVATRAFLTTWHVEHPLASGVELDEVRAALADQVPARIFRTLIQELSDEGAVVREGHLLRLSQHRIIVPDADQSLAGRILDRLGHSRLSPPDTKQLAADLAVEPRKLIELLRAMERQGSVVSVGPDLYFLSQSVEDVRAELVRALSRGGEITTAQFRDQYKTSRKYAIPLLEFFDRSGITVRIGDVRRLRTPRTERT